MRALSEMELEVGKHKAKLSLDDAATKIQLAFKVCLDRKRLSKCVFKLILFRNLVEKRAHNVDIITYKAFEKMLKYKIEGLVEVAPKRISTAEIQGQRIT